MKRSLSVAVQSLLLAAGPALFIEVWMILPGFSMEDHVFRPDILRLLVLIIAVAAGLAFIRTLHAGILSRRFGIPSRRILKAEGYAWLPLVFLGAAPLALVHYIGREDFLARMKGLLAGVIIAAAALKILQFRDLKKEAAGSGPPVRGGSGRLSTRAKSTVLFLLLLVLFNLGSITMIRRGALFSGDEPHYLMITRSLLRDGDLDLVRDYEQKGYRDFLPDSVTLHRHVTLGRKEGTRYSAHSPGTAIALVPFYAAARYLGLGKTGFNVSIRFGMSLIGALFCVQLFLLARRFLSDERTAFALVLLTALTTPVYFYSIHVYPEIIAALLAVSVFRILRSRESINGKGLALAGFCLSLFIWFHAQKYLPLVASLGLYGLWILIRDKKRPSDYVAFLAAPLVVTAAYLYFQDSIYGSLSLSAVSWWRPDRGGLNMHSIFSGIPFRLRWDTLAGYLLDQKDGLLFYAPVYFFAFLGMARMLRKKAGDFWGLVLLALPYVLFSAFLTQRTGYAPQARPLTAVIWALILPLGVYIVRRKEKLMPAPLAFRTAAAAGIILTIILILNPFALYQETTAGATERSGSLFVLLSNLHFDLPSLLPSYIKSAEGPWRPNWIWPFVLVAAAAVLSLGRKSRRRIGLRGGSFLACAGTAVFILWFVFYPRSVIGQPAHVSFPDGRKITFYSLSRVARQESPGRFLLAEDGRAYVFTFSLLKPARHLRIEFGSTAGGYDVSLDYFDKKLFSGRTDREIRTERIVNPAAYRWKGRWLYWVTLRISKNADVPIAEHPYVISIEPGL